VATASEPLKFTIAVLLRFAAAGQQTVFTSLTAAPRSKFSYVTDNDLSPPKIFRATDVRRPWRFSISTVTAKMDIFSPPAPKIAQVEEDRAAFL